ncbi:NfeD family protein [[Actinomadura] parvosata]|uniref:NfeD family protein n=1 Tax=[Actinomadura] parvosata TaxID=1955412 RepID=UPI00406C693A
MTQRLLILAGLLLALAFLPLLAGSLFTPGAARAYVFNLDKATEKTRNDLDARMTAADLGDRDLIIIVGTDQQCHTELGPLCDDVGTSGAIVRVTPEQAGRLLPALSIYPDSEEGRAVMPPVEMVRDFRRGPAFTVALLLLPVALIYAVRLVLRRREAAAGHPGAQYAAAAVRRLRAQSPELPNPGYKHPAETPPAQVLDECRTLGRPAPGTLQAVAARQVDGGTATVRTRFGPDGGYVELDDAIVWARLAGAASDGVHRGQTVRVVGLDADGEALRVLPGSPTRERPANERCDP